MLLALMEALTDSGGAEVRIARVHKTSGSSILLYYHPHQLITSLSPQSYAVLV